MQTEAGRIQLREEIAFAGSNPAVCVTPQGSETPNGAELAVDGKKQTWRNR